MSSKPTHSTAARDALGDFAPKLVELTDRVLFDDVWVRTDLSAWHRWPAERDKTTTSARPAAGIWAFPDSDWSLRGYG